MFVEHYLQDIHETNVHLKGHCTLTYTKQGYYSSFRMCLNRQEITNLFLVPHLEEYDYVVDYNTN